MTEPGTAHGQTTCMNSAQLNPFELVITASKDLEHLLETLWGAQGKGLHEKLSAIENQIPADIQKRIRRLATIRNKVVHDAGYHLDDPDGYARDYQRVRQALLQLRPGATGTSAQTSASVSDERDDTAAANRQAEAILSALAQNRPVNKGFPFWLWLSLVVLIGILTGVAGAMVAGFWLLAVYVLVRLLIALTRRSNLGSPGWALVWSTSLMLPVLFAAMSQSGSLPAAPSALVSPPPAAVAARTVAPALAPSSPAPVSGSVPANAAASQVTAIPTPAPVMNPASQAVQANSTSPLPQVLAQARENKARAFDRIDHQWLQTFRDKLQVTLAEPEFKANANGTFDVLVTVTWALAPQAIEAVLDPDLAFGNNPRTGVITVTRAGNRNEKQRQPYSYELYQQLLKHPVKLMLSLQGYESGITLATGRDCFVSCKGEGDSEFQIHYSNKAALQTLLFSSYQGEQNPVVIRQVPAAVIASARQMTAFIVAGGIKHPLAERPLHPDDTAVRLNASKDAQTQAFDQLRQGVFEYVRQHIKVQYEAPQYNPVSDAYDVYVDVRWQVDDAPVLAALTPYLVVDREGRQGEKIVIKKAANAQEKQKVPFSQALYEELLRYEIKLKLSMGSSASWVTLASGRDCFVSCRGKGDSEYHFHLSNEKHPSALLFSGYLGEQNPVRIKAVPQALIAQAIKTEVIWVRR